jgi:hypothetical protein
MFAYENRIQLLISICQYNGICVLVTNILFIVLIFDKLYTMNIL